MPTPKPIYTAANCAFAYQLNWALTVFWKTVGATEAWLEPLQAATEPDGIRVLKHRSDQPALSQFLVSTQPHVAALKVPAAVKGRLQYLVRASRPQAFQRNYALRSIGSTKRNKLDHYLATQLEHHPLADERLRQQFARYQVYQPQIDLAQPRRTSHALYWYNLHVVIVNEGRWRESRDDQLQRLRAMVVNASAAKGHWLSRAGILADHMHLLLGCSLQEAPQEVALSYMNNLAYVCGMKPVFKFSCFVGTVGEYDLGAVK